MKYLHIIQTAVTLFALALLSGCGASNSGVFTAAGGDTLKASQACIDCHKFKESPVVAGAKIADQWKDSNHNTATSGKAAGAGCIDCHEPSANHPNDCSRCHGGVPSAVNVNGTDLVRNPDADGKCYKCHSSSNMTYGHFTNITTLSAAPASRVSTNYRYKCRACHDPHNVNVTQTARDWAASAHGDPNGVAWKYYDFKEYTPGGNDRRACIRCHTTTGYQDYVTGKKQAFPTTTWATPGDKTKQMLVCDACHTSYDFKNSVRKLGAFTAPYGAQNATLPNDGLYPITYPDSGQSNICIRCHAGRENGGSIDAQTTPPVKGQYKSAITELSAIAAGTNFGTFNSHYLAAALNFYGKAGFHFYSSMNRYNTGYNTGANFGNWNHGKLGMIDPATGKNFVATQQPAGTPGINTDSGSNGPCIACHRGNQGGTVNLRSHLGKPHLTALSVAPAGGCYGCHGAGTSAPENMELMIEEEKVLFDGGMDFFEWNLRNHYLVNDSTTGNKVPSRQIWYYEAGYPYFYTSTTLTAPDVKPVSYTAANWFKGSAWTMGTNDLMTGKMFLGTAYNFNMLKREKGAHVHNRTYSRRLMYDSIQYLQYGVVSSTDTTKKVNFANWSTANPGLSKKYTYLLGPITYKGSSAIRAWMTNGNRTTGAVTGFRK